MQKTNENYSYKRHSVWGGETEVVRFKKYDGRDKPVVDKY